MLKREIKYENFDGEETSEVFYFNLSESELIELELEFDGSLGEMLEGIVKAQDHKEIVKWFKKIVLMAYGEKSEDGRRFIKSEEGRTEFSQTAAYNALFMELATNEDSAATFIQGVLPRSFSKQDQDKPVLAPPVPPKL